MDTLLVVGRRCSGGVAVDVRMRWAQIIVVVALCESVSDVFTTIGHGTARPLSERCGRGRGMVSSGCCTASRRASRVCGWQRSGRGVVFGVRHRRVRVSGLFSAAEVVVRV